jgi:hypothetical protein
MKIPTNGRPVTVAAKREVRMTLVRVHLPFWRRWFSGEVVLGILGTVQDVALLTRAQAQACVEAGYQSKWVPYQESAAPTAPPKGPEV